MKWILKIIAGFLLFCLAIVLFGAVTQYLWNWIMPYLFHLPVVSFEMAFGMVILSKILFGGMRMRGGHYGWWGPKAAYWKAKMEGMTPEEREKFKSEFANRCRHKWGNRWGNINVDVNVEKSPE